MTMSDHLNSRIESARAARREARTQDSWEQYQEVVTLSRRQGKKEKLVAGLKGLGQIERDRGNSEAALPYYLEATNLARDIGDELDLAHTIRHLADAYREIGNLDSAESCYLEVLAIYRANPRTRTLDLANAIRPMALLMEKLLRIDDARVLWEEAEQLYSSAAIDEGIEECQQAVRRCS